MIKTCRYRALALAALSMAAPLPGAGSDALAPKFFDQSVRPLLAEYCLKCHSTEKHKGDLDLERFSSLGEVRRHPKAWQTVAEQLANNEMPPKEKPQPSAGEKASLSNWVQAVLDDVARERAGDPGPVVLRRLSNAEYTYTIRDLTAVDTLDPAREFPVDGAAGEGFMNTGQALVMSPSLITKYLDAGKEIASHALLLPDGIRFSAKTTRRDWTDEILAQIREFYRQFTDSRAGGKVNLQGIVFETNEDGGLPLEKYLRALLEERDALSAGTRTVEGVGGARGLSARYLAGLWQMLSAHEPSFLLDPLRARWRAAKPDDAAGLVAEVAQWQKALWKFNSVGHIGKAGGPKAWMEAVNPLAARQEVRLMIPASPSDGEVTLYLIASDAGDGNEHDYVVWEQPRLVAPGRPDLLLRDLRAVSQELAQRRERIFATAAKSLAAAEEASATPGESDISALARKHGVEAEGLAAWFDYLGIRSGGAPKVEGYFTNQIATAAGYDFIKGWGSQETPNLVANSSGQQVRIPGNMKPHSVAVHPSPRLQAAVGWRSPVAATLRVEARITPAHPECGNGITWSLELRRGRTRQRLAAGTAQGGKEVKAGPFENLAVQIGDLVSLLIGPRDGNHACDLTAVDLALSSAGEPGRAWNLAADVSPDVLAGNPHADRFGNDAVWHFYAEPDNGGSEIGPVIPAGSLLAKWQSAASDGEKRQLADAVQALLESGPSAAKESPDAALYRQLASLGGPLFSRMLVRRPQAETNLSGQEKARALAPSATAWGLDPGQFGRHPNGKSIDPASLCLRAPAVVEVRLPADLVAGSELVTSAELDKETGAEGSVQVRVSTTKPEQTGLVPSALTVTQGNGMWTSANRQVSHSTPIIVNEGSLARRRIEAGFDEFRHWFPAALCYTKIVPVDEVVTLTLFYREDDHLSRLMLDEAQKAKLDRLWDELHYVSQDALTLVDVFEQLWQFATQDADPKVFEPLRQPINDRAAAFRRQLVDTQPKHLEGLLEFANRAYRRPLTGGEREELRGLYGKLREEELSHDQAIRLMLARVLVAPTFLYRAETPCPGPKQGPVNDWELANRLSYFLWSSMPDGELLDVAGHGGLRNPDVLAAQTRRMLRDPRARRLATEFGAAWLQIHGFDELNEKSERHFPTFTELRGAMYEESILFFTDFFQGDRSILNILDADYTFLNEPLAKHYGIPGVTGANWRQVNGMKQFSRGGVLGQGATLAKQSGASRTSPILRGNWVSEVLLGDKLPRPPKGVPTLPEDETATGGLTVRQLVEKHTSDPNCFRCHARIDPYGYALEAFDAIGRHRDKDLGDRPIDTRAQAFDGAQFEGLEGLRDYLLTTRREAFLRQFCRKLLGYSLGRAVQLSDGPLLDEMRAELEAKDYRVGAAIETIVRSRQFREIRGREMSYED